jgi:hypothetical protein
MEEVYAFTKALTTALVKGLVVGAALAAAGLLVWSVWYVFRYGLEQGAYAVWYNAPPQNVLIYPKPHDCEFLKAPIGSKYCHYEKDVNVGVERGERFVTVRGSKQSD